MGHEWGKQTVSLGGDGLGLVEVLQLALLALGQQLGDQLPSVLKVLQPPFLLLVGVLALGLQVEEFLVDGAVVLVEGVVVVAFFEEALALAFEVLLCDLGLLLLDALLALEVLLGDVGVLLQPALVVLLRALQLALDVLLPTAPQTLQLAVDLLLLQLLTVALNGQLLLQPAAGLQLLGNGVHQ
jgi:hypothetical protein